VCKTSQFITLSENEVSQITWCKGCKIFSLSYKCCCASFTEKEINQFSKVLKGLRESEYNYEFMGKPQTIVTTPNSQIGFCLTEKDTANLIELVSEAVSVFQAFKIIYC